jgi:hypothetical protein
MGFFSLCGIGNAEVPSADLVAKIVLTKIRYRREQTYCSFDIKPRSAVLIKPNPPSKIFLGVESLPDRTYLRTHFARFDQCRRRAGKKF